MPTLPKDAKVFSAHDMGGRKRGQNMVENRDETTIDLAFTLEFRSRPSDDPSLNPIGQGRTLFAHKSADFALRSNSLVSWTTFGIQGANIGV